MSQHTSSSSNESENLTDALPVSVDGFCYDGVGALIREWQASGTEQSLWVYLGMSESIYKNWVSRLRRGVYDT
jgi:hypothetical protein